MIHAYVTIITGAGTAESVLESVRELRAVTEAHVVAGDYDVIAELEGEEIYDVLSSVTSEIQALDGVGTTRTYIQLD